MVASLVVCAAQTAADKPPEPESIGAFYYFDASAKTLKLLPKEEFRRHTGGRRPVVTIKVEGAASSFHVAQGDQKTFVFKVFKDEEAGKARLYQFNVKGSERDYELGNWKGRDYMANAGLAVNVGKFGESSYKLTPDAPLAPGEYALTMGPTVFTFGVQ